MKIKALLLVAALAAGASIVSTVPANAADFSVSLAKTNNLFRAGDSIDVTVSNTPVAEGVYVRFCAAAVAPATRPTDCFGQGAWASSDPTQQGFGASPLDIPVALSVQKDFTSAATHQIDCTVVSCVVFVRRDHNGPGDLSLDTVVPVTFAPAYSVALAKTANLVAVGDSIAVTVSGLPKNNGIYVRLCAAPAVVSERPTDCFGQGVWASTDSAQLGFGAVDANAVINLAVQAAFTQNSNQIDCAVVSCGVFVRRDHLDSTDTSLDSFTPITFAVPVVSPASKGLVTATAAKGKGKITLNLANYSGKKVIVYIGSHKFTRVLKNNATVLTFSSPRKLSVEVRVTLAGKQLFKKKVTA
jgi:hypothetical protein